MKKTAPVISDSAAEFYPSLFSSLNAGLTYTLESFPALYRRTLHDLRGTFSRNELMLMVDVFNSTALTAPMAGQHIIVQVADGCDLDRLDKKWGIEKTAMIEKLRALPIFALSCLEILANGFWYRQGAETFRSGEDLEKWVGQLL